MMKPTTSFQTQAKAHIFQKTRSLILPQHDSDNSNFCRDQKVAAVRTAQNLMEVMRTSNVEEIVSLEETFLQIISRLPREEMLFVDQVFYFLDLSRRLCPIKYLDLGTNQDWRSQQQRFYFSFLWRWSCIQPSKLGSSSDYLSFRMVNLIIKLWK